MTREPKPLFGFDQAAAARRSAPRKRLWALALAGVLSVVPGALAEAQVVNVLYAGSLVNLMEKGIGPAFQKASGIRLRGYAGGSQLLANEIKGKIRRADIFISALPKVNESLTGAANGDWLDWFLPFARSPLVIGFNAKSRFAKAFKTQSWIEALSQPGLRIGRTDPKLDPKGGLTIALMKRAQAFYKMPGLERKLLGAPENPAQTLPEEALVGRLQSGQIDAGFFYSIETKEAKIPAASIPPQITPTAIYTIAIVRRAPNPSGAEKFVDFLLGEQGRALMKAHGLMLMKATFKGNAKAAPSSVRAAIKGAQ